MIAGLFVGAVLLAPADPGPAADETRRDALARYGAAVWNLRRERLLTAARQLEAAAKQDPNAAEPLKELARLYAQLGRDPEAIRTARKALDKDPDDRDTAARLARLLFDAGETKEALAAAKQALDGKPASDRPEKAVRVLRDLAGLCEKAGDFAAAEAALRGVLEIVSDGRAEVVRAAAFTPRDADAEAADAFERLGAVLVKRARYAAAADAFAAAAKLYADPRRANDPTGAARLGWNLSGAYQAAGEPEKALPPLDEFLALRPQAAEPFQRLAALLRAANRADEVVPGLRKHLARDKQNRPLAAVLGAELAADPLTRAEADELFLSLTTYADRPPARDVDPRVVAVVVKSHLDTGRPREVVGLIDRAFARLDDRKAKGKSDAPATDAEKRFAADLTRAVADALKGLPRGVDAVLEGAAEDLRLGTAHAHGTHYFVAALAARHRRLDLAEYHFRQAASGAKETQDDATAALIDVLWRARRPDKVERVCRDALDGATIQPSLLFHLARALAEQGKADKALEAADRCILQAAATDRLAARLNRHYVLRALGRWDEAIEYGNKLADEFTAPADRRQVRYAQAGAYWGAKKGREAEAALRAMLDDDADDALACNDLGYHLADQGRDLDEAERLVRHALLLDRIGRRKAGDAEPESAAYRDSLGWVLFRKGKLAEARAELEAALQLPEGAADPVVWDHLGDVLFRSGEKGKAKAAWLKAQELYEADLRMSSRGRRDGRLDEVKRKLRVVQ